MVEFQAVMIKTVPMVRGVALVDLAAPDVEALRLLGGADGCNCEEAQHVASRGLPSLVPAGRGDS